MLEMEYEMENMLPDIEDLPPTVTALVRTAIELISRNMDIRKK